MNTLKFYPKKTRETYIRNIKNAGIKIQPQDYHNLILKIALAVAFTGTILFYLFKINLLFSLLVFVGVNLLAYFRISLQASARIKKMETIFPDVVSLMASNLRSGITIDRAFVLASRPEFAPLDNEIIKAGKDIATGKDIGFAFKSMAERIDSEKISKTISLIISGLKAGGNIADLLEQTAANMKEKEYIEKRAAANILMYVIFIFFAVGIGAPVLFGLSSVLVEIIINLITNIPEVGTSQINVPITFKSSGVSANFVIYFAIIFMIVSDLISCLVVGLVNKGEKKAGLKYFLPLVAVSLSIFFIIRKILSGFLVEAFSSM